MTTRTTHPLVAFAAASLCAQLWLSSSTAHAQVAVLRVDPAAEGLCAALEGALTDVQLVRDPGYFAEAQNQGLDPSSGSTLEVIVPLLGLRLAVVPQSADDRSMLVEFRDGRSGASMGTAAIPLEGGLLGFSGRNALRAEVFRRLGAEPPGASPPGASSPRAGIASAPEESGPLSEAASDDSAGTGPPLVVNAAIGIGVGTRALEWPASGQQQRVDTGPFAAYELAASFMFAASDSVSIGPDLVYQSSLSHEITEAHIAGPGETIGIRSHRFSGLLAATFDADDEGTFRISPAIGYGSRGLRPAVHHLLTPSYSLAGPIAQLAFHIGLGHVELTLAPEAQLIVVGDELEEEGVDGSGFSIGGEAALSVALSRAVALGLTYREAHALLSAGSDSASDVERFVTTRLRWTP